MSDLILSKGIEFSKTGLTFKDTITFQEWLAAGNKLSTMNKYIHFWIGDWLNYGEQKYGEMYAQALDETSYVYGTLRNDKWVSSRIPLSRRHDNLSWSHHYEVADLEPEDQDILLTKAEKQKLSVSKFRKLVYLTKKRLDMPELPETPASTHADFDKVQTVVDSGLLFLEGLQVITEARLDDDAQDYLKSHLKDVIKVVGGVLLTYEKQKPNTDAVDK